jgi:uncharacterized protein
MATLKNQKFAVVTGASSGIGLELARQCVLNGFEVLVCAEDAEIHEVARQLSGVVGKGAVAVQADLAKPEGVEQLVAAVEADGRSVEVLMLNAGVGVGGAFLETSLDKELNMIALNTMAVVHLAKRLIPPMAARGHGRVLITASIASTMPTPYAAVYGATKAFDMSFAEALRNELADHGVSVTALQPGATDTNFFNRAEMLNTPVGEAEKDDPAQVAKEGFEAMMAGKDSVIAGSMKSKRAGLANEILPETVKASMAAKQHKPNDTGNGRS